MKYLILSIILTPIAFSSILVNKNQNSSKQTQLTEILTNIFYEELYKKTKGLSPEVEVKKSRVSLNNGLRGKMIIERMKQKNREKIARMRGFDPDKVKRGSDLVKLQKDDNKDILVKMNEEKKILEEKYKDLPPEMRAKKVWQDQAKIEIENIRKKVLVDHKEWRKKHSKTLDEWEEKKKNYSKQTDEYKKTLINIPLVLPVSFKDIKKDVEIEITKDYHFVASSLVPEVRDQQFRPTCSSFAGVRSVEILLAQNQKKMDLSEQYFYWASKPRCQTRKCLNKGSWVGNGLKYSQEVGGLDIPLEKDCHYNQFPIPNNETQIPLKNSCSKGVVKIQNFKYLSTLDEVISSLKNDKPVVASIKLTPNFYKNKGIILAKESNIGGELNSHANGHAVLLVGYLKLPKILNEGSVCFITANSWGEGWGNGGYSCLSEKWMLENRKRNPFVVVDQIQI
jgi:C1A family cysteine protease